MSKLVSLIGLVLLSMMSYGQTFSDFSREEVIADLEFLYHQLKAVHPNSEGLQEEGVSKLINELNAEFYSEADAFFHF